MTAARNSRPCHPERGKKALWRKDVLSILICRHLIARKRFFLIFEKSSDLVLIAPCGKRVDWSLESSIYSVAETKGQRRKARQQQQNHASCVRNWARALFAVEQIWRCPLIYCNCMSYLDTSSNFVHSARSDTFRSWRNEELQQRWYLRYDDSSVLENLCGSNVVLFPILSIFSGTTFYVCFLLHSTGTSNNQQNLQL